MSSYIPHSNMELKAWLANFQIYLEFRFMGWGIPEGRYSQFMMKKSEFDEAQEAAELPNAGKVDRHRRDAAAKEVSSDVRELVNEYLRYNKQVSDADREEMGLHVADTTRTPVPVPTHYPAVNVERRQARSLQLYFHEDGSDSKARPYGVNGAVVAWGLLAAPPATQLDLPHTALATRSPYTMEFQETDRGKTAYIALCWQNERGQKGPWCDIIEAIVP